MTLHSPAFKGVRRAHPPAARENADQPETPSQTVPLAGLASPEAPVRRSLRVGAAHDPAELEAESSANLIVERLRGGASAEPATEPVTGRDADGHNHAEGDDHCGPVRRAAVVGEQGGGLDADTAGQIEQLRGTGQPLPAAVRRTMEAAFGADLGSVRVHTGGRAAELNDRIAAHAFTTGNDIVFRSGLPDIGQESGQRLLAHELTHVLQQRGTNVVGALRRQAASVRQRETPQQLSAGMVSITTEQDDSPTDALISRLWDISVKPAKVGMDFVIQNIVISDRPPNPDTSAMTMHGGKSFHHESAWTWIERNVTQFVGKPLQEVVSYLVKYGIDPTMAKLADPGADAMSQVIALNSYFHDYLSTKAEAASGWLGPTGSHASQGGKISGALRSLQSSGWTKENIFKALTVSFEPGPDVTGRALWLAAQAHADAFYAANQQLLEDEGADATIDLEDHEEIVEVIKDWDTQYWDADYDSSAMEEEKDGTG